MIYHIIDFSFNSDSFRTLINNKLSLHIMDVLIYFQVFLGGVPWDITEGILVQAFSKFGTIKIEWPGKDMPNQPKGYCYIIFEAEKKVIFLISYQTKLIYIYLNYLCNKKLS